MEGPRLQRTSRRSKVEPSVVKWDGWAYGGLILSPSNCDNCSGSNACTGLFWKWKTDRVQHLSKYTCFILGVGEKKLKISDASRFPLQWFWIDSELALPSPPPPPPKKKLPKEPSIKGTVDAVCFSGQQRSCESVFVFVHGISVTNVKKEKWSQNACDIFLN